MESRNDGCRQFCTHPQAMLEADRMISIPQGSFDQVNLADEVQRDPRVASRGVLIDLGLACLIKFSANVRLMPSSA